MPHPLAHRRVPTGARLTVLLMAMQACLPIACAVRPPATVPTVEAYGAEGRGPTRSDLEALAANANEGLVIRYAAGDRIAVSLSIEGSLIAVEEPSEIVVTVKQPIDVWFGPRGMQVRVDGDSWQPLLDAIDGDVALSTGFSSEDAVNRATISIRAEPRR